MWRRNQTSLNSTVKTRKKQKSGNLSRAYNNGNDKIREHKDNKYCN